MRCGYCNKKMKYRDAVFTQDGAICKDCSDKEEGK